MPHNCSKIFFVSGVSNQNLFSMLLYVSLSETHIFLKWPLKGQCYEKSVSKKPIRGCHRP
jgi:hypothetical protein